MPLPTPRYFNRELSWLAFNRRVLEQAMSDQYPLLERLRYLAFVSSNLDEFFEIRVAGLIQQLNIAGTDPSPDGLTPRQQLTQIHTLTAELVADQYACWQNQLIPALSQERIGFKHHDSLTPAETTWLRAYYEREVYPVLTPLAIDPAHPFPQFTNKALNILVSLDNPTNGATKKKMAVIPVPRVLPRLVKMGTADDESAAYIFLSDVIRLFAHRLFPGYRILGAWGFRITRNSDLYIDEEEADNLLHEIEEGLLNLKKGAAVRLEIREGVDDALLKDLLEALQLPEEYVFRVDGPPNLMRLMSLYDAIDRPDLKFKPFTPYTPPSFARPEKIFEQIAQGDILLHHPYDSFTPIVDFIQQAARDPQVFAIKQVLYRTSGDSPITEALSEASRNGKQVTALIELKARFDEANNIHWARQLEEQGVHVVYGLVGLKTHCKACLVVRRETSGLKRYVHLGSGNYNPRTAKTYTDVSLFTAKERITEEVAALFNTLTGFATAPLFSQLLVAPFNLHARTQELIRRETVHARTGKPAYIFAKLNSLVDQQTIEALYEASGAGVKVDLVVRGACCLVPGLPGQSENIRVHSILGRFLEHSRFYYFLNHEGESELFAGSADWMPRNFFRRIEAVFPIMDPKLKKIVIQEWLPKFFENTQGSTQLMPNGSYHPVTNLPSFSIQRHFLEQAELNRAQAVALLEIAEVTPEIMDGLTTITSN